MPRSRSSRSPIVSKVGVTSTSSLVSNSTFVMSSSFMIRFRAEPVVPPEPADPDMAQSGLTAALPAHNDDGAAATHAEKGPLRMRGNPDGGGGRGARMRGGRVDGAGRGVRMRGGVAGGAGACATEGWAEESGVRMRGRSVS